MRFSKCLGCFLTEQVQVVFLEQALPFELFARNYCLGMLLFGLRLIALLGLSRARWFLIFEYGGATGENAYLAVLRWRDCFAHRVLRYLVNLWHIRETTRK